jgi:hypothetical protein
LIDFILTKVLQNFKSDFTFWLKSFFYLSKTLFGFV